MNRKSSVKINAILNIFKTCSSIFLPLISYPYVLRVLLPENIGKVNFSNAYVSYFSLIAGLGISTYAIRECSKVRENQNEFNKIASQIFTINVITTTIAYLFLFISLLFFHQLSNYRLLILIYSTTILLTTLGADWVNTAVDDFLYISIRSILFQILYIVLIFLFVKEQNDYYKYEIISAFSVGGANFLNIFYRRKYCSIKLVKSVDFKRHLSSIILMFVMILSQTIFNTADTTMLGLMKGDYEVGIYSTAVKVNLLIGQLVSSILYVLLPKLSCLFASNDYTQINTTLRKIFGIILLIGLPCFSGAFILSDEIILIIGGSNYVEAPLVLRIILLSFLFSLVGGSFLGNMVLLPSGNEKKFMIICCITAFFNVITNYIFIPKFGVYAAAGTTAASSFLIMILLLISVDKRIKICKKLKLVLAPIVGSAIIVTVCILFKVIIGDVFIRTVICIISSTMIYILMLYVLRNEFFIDILVSIKLKLKKNRKNI